MYLNINLGDRCVTALLDSGSAINIISKDLFDSISPTCVLCYDNVYGTAKIKFCLWDSSNFQIVSLYILKEAAHPIILGTQYLEDNIFFLNFGKGQGFSSVKRSVTLL